MFEEPDDGAERTGWARFGEDWAATLVGLTLILMVLTGVLLP